MTKNVLNDIENIIKKTINIGNEIGKLTGDNKYEYTTAIVLLILYVFEEREKHFGKAEKEDKEKFENVLNGFFSKELEYIKQYGLKEKFEFNGLIEVSTLLTNGSDWLGVVYQGVMNGKNRSGNGIFFTPKSITEIGAKICRYHKDNISSVYDPTCGSGSMLQCYISLSNKKDLKIYGQELLKTSAKIGEIGLFLTLGTFKNIDIQEGDTLKNPKHLDKKFDLILSNPPYGIKWDAEDDKNNLQDERFKRPGKLAPKGKADIAFIMHSLYQMTDKGIGVFVVFPGMLYRGGNESYIRKYIIENNFVEGVIQCPYGLFEGTNTTGVILILNKNKKDKKVKFLNAQELFVKRGKQNFMDEEHINKVLEYYFGDNEIDGIFSMYNNDELLKMGEKNGYDLNVSTYIKTKENEFENFDILNLENEIREKICIRIYEDLKKIETTYGINLMMGIATNPDYFEKSLEKDLEISTKMIFYIYEIYKGIFNQIKNKDLSQGYGSEGGTLKFGYNQLTDEIKDKFQQFEKIVNIEELKKILQSFDFNFENYKNERNEISGNC